MFRTLGNNSLSSCTTFYVVSIETHYDAVVRFVGIRISQKLELMLGST